MVHYVLSHCRKTKIAILTNYKCISQTQTNRILLSHPQYLLMYMVSDILYMYICMFARSDAATAIYCISWSNSVHAGTCIYYLRAFIYVSLVPGLATLTISLSMQLSCTNGCASDLVWEEPRLAFESGYYFFEHSLRCGDNSRAGTNREQNLIKQILYIVFVPRACTCICAHNSTIINGYNNTVVYNN